MLLKSIGFKMTSLQIITIYLGVTLVYGQGIGKILIDTSENVVPTLFVMSVRDFPLTEIRVSITAVDNTVTPPQTEAIVGTVDVTCEASTTSSGFARADFSTLNLNEAGKVGNVRLSNLIPGRAVEVKCYGVSQTGTQFNRTASVSDPVFLTITPDPVVSICTGGDIPIQDSSLTSPAFITVQVSDLVKVASVTVTCAQTATPGPGDMQLNFVTATIPIGQNSTRVQYSLVQTGNAVQVSCYGASASGNQYTQLSSRGAAVNFVRKIPAIKIYPERLTTTATSFNMLVKFTSWTGGGVNQVACQADRLNTSAQINSALTSPLCLSSPTTTTTTTTTTPAPSGSTVSPINTAAVWDTYQLDPVQGILELRVFRNYLVSTAVTEYVVISCCGTNSTSTVSDAALVTAQLTPNQTIDWTKATEPASVNTATPYDNPAFVNISPCPCDITGNICDVGCCCDEDCTTQEEASFTQCIPGLEGGQSAPTPEYKCTSTHFNKEDYFPLMCVETEYNALLGYFYSNTETILTSEAFNEKKTGEELYSYKENEVRTAARSSAGYKSGNVVRTVQEGAVRRIGTVVLPQRILSGQCSPEAPVPFMENVESDCHFELTTSVCSVGSTFNPLFYVESSTLKDPACPSPYQILADVSSKTVADTHVNYYCASGTYLNNYIKSTSQTVTNPTVTTTFNYSLPAVEFQDTCGNDIRNLDVQVDPSTDSTLPPRCAWDDGFTRPPAITVNNLLCDNAVLEVRYKFYWAGQTILKLNASVILGSVTLSTANNPVVVTQKHSSEFHHTTNATSQDNYRDQTTFLRSGKPGYDLGKPLLSGSTMTLSVGGRSFVNQNRSRQLSVWDTGVDGLCYNAGRKQIMFGEDTFSSCSVYLSSQDLSNDCKELRKYFINRLNDLMPADRIGRYGNNNPLDLKHWITVEKEDLSTLCSRAVNLTDEYIYSWSASGMCTDMITGINVDIMYGITGKANNQPIYEVLGAYVSYTNQTMSMSCASGDSACNAGVQAFQLTSSVNFIEVPGTLPARVMKYFDTVDDNVCKRDICWKEALYPLTGTYDQDNRSYVLAMVLLLIFLIIAYLFLTQPWWGYI